MQTTDQEHANASHTTESKLSEIEGTFQQRDAISEPNILTVIRKYIEVGGKPQTVVEMLSESYVGYGPMINVALEWVKLVDNAESKEVRTYAAGNKESDDPLWNFLSDIVSDNFEPEKFSDVFSSSGGMPTWLRHLTEDPGGRQLIYDLTDQYRNCLFLNFAVHHILQQGYDKEVAAMGGSISGNFNVFNRLFIRKIEELYSSNSVNHASVAKDLLQMCSSDEIKYVYTMLVLSGLKNMPYGAFFKRFAQELEIFASHNSGTTTSKMKSFFLTDEKHDPQHLEAAFCINTILRSSSIAPVDIQRLWKLYSGEKTPSWNLLKDSPLLDKLLSELYAPKRQLVENQINTIMEIISMAISKNNRGTPVSSAELLIALRNGKYFLEQVTNGVNVLRLDLSFLNTPVVSMGMVHWLKSKMTDPDFYDSGTLFFPCIELLLKEIIERQRLQRPEILQLICVSVNIAGNAFTELLKRFLNNVTAMLRYGEVSLFCSTCRELLSLKFDRSLTRHLTIGVLNTIGPPFSADFASLIMNLIISSGIEAVNRKDRSPFNLKVIDFLHACRKIDFGLELDKKQKILLKSRKAL